MKTTEQVVADLVCDGAAITIEPNGMPITVGLMQSIGQDRWFWWECGGDNEFHGHVIEGETTVWHGGLGVVWRKDGRFVAYLTTIEEAVDTKAEAAVMHAHFAGWLKIFDHDARLRGFIVRQIKART